MQKEIFIKGARENNLKNIDVTIPRDKLVVLTGSQRQRQSPRWPFDTIYAEGQRRYVESLSSYARMFLGQMDKPDVDYIDGLSPAISIDQKTTSKNPRSTVGTVTEIYDYLRLLWARVGTPHCPKCGKGDPPADHRPDHRPDHGPAGGHPHPGDGPGDPGQKGEHAKVLGGRPPLRLRPRPGGREPLRAVGGDPAGEEQEAPHRDRGGPAHHPPRHRPAPDGLRGDGRPTCPAAWCSSTC